MKHKNCGGDIIENWSKTYSYEREDGSIEVHPSYICLKCGREIFGDIDIEWFESIIEGSICIKEV